jgi:hypothetical protein
MMPWWLPFLTLVLGWLLRYFYDLKIQPTIDKRRKEAEKKQIEQEEKARQEREALKHSWENDRRILSELKDPLEQLATINRFPDSYPPDRCVGLLRSIGERAERIERPEFLTLREKLRNFSEKKESIHSTTLLGELLNIINGKYDRITPQDIINGIDAGLKSIPK